MTNCNCGKPLREDDSFCPGCGRAVKEVNLSFQAKPAPTIPILLTVIIAGVVTLCLLMGALLVTSIINMPIEGSATITRVYSHTAQGKILHIDERLVGSWDIVATHEWIRRYIFNSDGTGQTQLMSQVYRVPQSDAFFIWSSRGGLITMHFYHEPGTAQYMPPTYLAYSLGMDEHFGEDVLYLSAFAWEGEHPDYMHTLMRARY